MSNIKKSIKAISSIALLSLLNTSCGSGNSPQADNSIPNVNPNNLNFIFVQSFEPNLTGNNLSTTGFNHSLQFGQLLNKITSGNVNAILALDPWQNIVNGYPNMGPIQSIENYAALTASGIFDILPMTVGSYYKPTQPSIAYYIEEIIGQTSLSGLMSSGTFVLALPSQQINQTLSELSLSPNLYFTYTPITNYNQFAILSINKVSSVTATTYNDGITASNQYPNLNLKTTAACLESPVQFTIPCNPINGGINTNETTYIIRHTEAHPVNVYDNGNYVCQGQWRAIGAVNKLEQIMGGLPNMLYSLDPGESFSCSVGNPYMPTNESCTTYVRPSLTVNPFAIKNSMPLSLVPESNFYWSNYESMASYFYQNQQFNNQTILISWEHATTSSMVNYLVGSLCQQPNAVSQLPIWAGNDYDTVWKIQLNNSGDLTFSNTCEGISDLSLPLSCPNF